MGLKDMANCSERLDTMKRIMEKIVKLLIEQKRGKRKLENFWGGGGKGGGNQFESILWRKRNRY